MESDLSLPGDVGSVLERYLELVDATLPGGLEGLFLVGSIALMDYQPGRSDIDFVAVTHTPATSDDAVALELVHRELEAHFTPHFDGIYVSWDDLKRDPTEIDPVPHSHEGRFSATGGFDANPSTWLTMRLHPCPVRGTLPADLWHDAVKIRAWNEANLNSYWRDQMLRARGATDRMLAADTQSVMDTAIAWCVPGVSRLHYTMATGDVTSKAGACLYALAHFDPRWTTILREALALRRGEQPVERDASARWEDMVEFMAMVIDDAIKF